MDASDGRKMNPEQQSIKDQQTNSPHLQNLNQHAYDLLIQQGYFKNNNTDKAYEPTTMYYTIEIEKYNSVGRVQIINFRPKDTSGAIASQLGEAMKTIKDKESLYKRSIDY